MEIEVKLTVPGTNKADGAGYQGDTLKKLFVTTYGWRRDERDG